jgi:hypothetical protein
MKWRESGENFIIMSSVDLLFTKYEDDQIKKNEMGGHVTHTGEMRNAYKILVWIPDGKT